MVDTNNSTSHCGSGTLQAYLDNELSAQREDAVELHLEQCDECRTELDELRAMDQVIRQEIGFLRQCDVPPMNLEQLLQRAEVERVPAQIPAPAVTAEEPGWFKQLVDFMLGSTASRFALAGVALGAIVLFLLPPATQKVGPKDDILVKGWDARMLYSRYKSKTSANYTDTQTAQGHTALSPRDLIQFQYQVPRPTQMMIVGLNEKGEVFPLVIGDDKQSRAVQAGKGRFPREQSFQLDHYIGLERYFFVVSSKPFSFQEIKAAIQRAWRDNNSDLTRLKQLNQTWQVRSWLVQKKKRSKPLQAPR